jgi:protein SCO1/2
LKKPAATFTCALFAFVAALAADAPLPTNAALQGVMIEQKLGAQVPLDLKFADETGAAVKLADYFHGRPVLLTMVYYECPMLCTMTLNQLTRSLNGLSESAGEQFEIVTVSFNPRETPALAAAKKSTYLRSYRRPSAADGWHFLTGSQASIDSLTRSVGFNYRWDEQQQAYAHASAVMVLTPQGKLSRYFLGVDYPPTEVREALRAADAGTVGPPADAIYFYCFRYDPASGRYGLIISRALRVLGVLIVLGLAALVVVLHRISTRRVRTLALE